MSRNRKPSKATTDEIREFYKKTKDVISKNGMYFDSITKKYKKALKQDGKSKGSGRPLVADSKYKNFLKRLTDDEKGDMVSLEQRAREKGFSQLQKQRKLFGAEGAGAVAADVVAQAKVMKKAEKAVGKPPTNVKPKVADRPKQEKFSRTDQDLYEKYQAGMSYEDLKKEKDRLKILSDKGSPVVQPAQTKLKKRGGSKLADVEFGSEAWYKQQVMKARHDAERKGENGEEGMKAWRREQQKKYGLPPTATKKDIMNRATDERQRVSTLQKATEREEDYKQGKQEERSKEAESRGIQSGNLRKKKREEGEATQEEQAEKIEEVVVDNDKASDKPLHDLADVEHDIEHKAEEIFPQKGDGMETKEQNPNMRGSYNERYSGSRRKGQEFNEETKGETKTEREEDIPVPQQTEPNIKMEITDKPDLEVEIDKSPNEGIGGGQMGQSFISPASEKVSMERNRMKYSPKRLYEECRSFVKIYSDDIKTPSWKKLMEQFSKMSEKTPAVALRKIHRELEEEVIEYYQGRKGLRLGVIIDPSVLGINVAQLQGMMNPQMPMAMGNQVREVGTQQRKVKTKDIHYHLGGIQHATDAILPEGNNIEKHVKDTSHVTGRVKVPIQGRQNWLLKKSGRSRIPKNLKIR